MQKLFMQEYNSSFAHYFLSSPHKLILLFPQRNCGLHQVMQPCFIFEFFKLACSINDTSSFLVVKYAISPEISESIVHKMTYISLFEILDNEYTQIMKKFDEPMPVSCFNAYLAHIQYFNDIHLAYNL